MTHTHAKGRGQRPLGSKVTMATDAQTDVIALPDSLMQSVINQHFKH